MHPGVVALLVDQIALEGAFDQGAYLAYLLRSTRFLEERIMQLIPAIGEEIGISGANREMRGLGDDLLRFGDGVAEVLERAEDDPRLEHFLDRGLYHRPDGNAFAWLVLGKERTCGKRQRRSL